MTASLMSVIVCTYNRCKSLSDTLQSLEAQQPGGGKSLEILVVDNNSADRTPQVVERFARASRWPVRYVREPRQGIAYARNMGLQEARGKYVAFVDDDAVAAPGWIEAIVRCFGESEADMVGGKIAPLWLTPRPDWLADDLLGPVNAFDLSPIRRRCTSEREAFLTTNCALRVAGVARYGSFDASLGRRGARWIGGEDFELFARWLRQGALIVYEPAAVVRHKVGAERVTPDFFRRWFEDVGYTQGHQTRWKWHYLLSVAPLWRWGALLAAAGRYAWTRIAPASEAQRLRREFWWRFHRGFARERFDHWLRNPRCHFAEA